MKLHLIATNIQAGDAMKTKLPSHRIEGAFLGLALGDAYGRTLEFVSGEAVQQNTVLVDSNSFMWSEETHISMYVADAVLQMPQSIDAANCCAFPR